MPSHPERVRRNYQCPACDGDGYVYDYEGSDRCHLCDGTGVCLNPPPPPRRTSLTLVESAVAGVIGVEAVSIIKRNLAMANLINRSYR